MVLDELARRFTGGARAFDLDGRLAAAAGRVDDALLAELWRTRSSRAAAALARPRAVRRPVRRAPAGAGGPASRPGLDRPAGHRDRAHRLRRADAFTALCAGRLRLGEVVVSGGGARNPELMRRLAAAFAPVPVGTTDVHGLPGD